MRGLLADGLIGPARVTLADLLAADAGFDPLALMASARDIVAVDAETGEEFSLLRVPTAGPDPAEEAEDRVLWIVTDFASEMPRLEWLESTLRWVIRPWEVPEDDELADEETADDSAE